jgi:hypothetical protein
MEKKTELVARQVFGVMDNADQQQTRCCCTLKLQYLLVFDVFRTVPDVSVSKL